MPKGKVKWYNEVKGFGFIEPEEGEDLFVHKSGLVDAFKGLDPDQEVEYEVKQGDRGSFATNVKIVE